MNKRSITVVSAGLSTPSSSRMLANRLTKASIEELNKLGVEAEARTFELRDYAHEITNNMIAGFAAENLAKMIGEVTQSDGLIVVTPIFTTSYSGLFKSFIDILDPEALKGKPVLLGANAGTARHSLAIDYALRPIFAYLHAEPVSSGVFAASSDWGDNADEVAPLSRRIENAAREFACAISRKEEIKIKDPFDPDYYLGENHSFDHLLGGFNED